MDCSDSKYLVDRFDHFLDTACRLVQKSVRRVFPPAFSRRYMKVLKSGSVQLFLAEIFTLIIFRLWSISLITTSKGVGVFSFSSPTPTLKVESPENFISKECFFPEIFKSQKSLMSHERCEIFLFFGTLISLERNVLLSWSFQEILFTDRPICG